MYLNNEDEIRTALRLVGELLAADGVEYAIVVVGGAAVSLLGVVDRSTSDVDILAFATPRGKLEPEPGSMVPPPLPLPELLQAAVRTVAADMGLDTNWLNAESALQWRTGLPKGIARRIEWTRYANLWVGIISQHDLVFLKLFAAVDSEGTRSKHYRDLIALNPSEADLLAAATWVSGQDASPVFSEVLTKVVDLVRKELQDE